MDILEVMDKICIDCPYNKHYRIGLKCTKFKSYPYFLNECPLGEQSVVEEGNASCGRSKQSSNTDSKPNKKRW